MVAAVSGGSFNYLYVTVNPSEHYEELSHMIAELESRGMTDAANASRALYSPREGQHEDPIRSLWQAVEWHVSGDYGPVQVLEAYERWKKEARPFLEDLAKKLRRDLVQVELAISRFKP